MEVNKELVRQIRTLQTWEVEERLAGGWVKLISSIILN